MENPAVEVKIPLINPNEPEALVSAVHVKEGQQVSSGDLLCTLETTKSANDLESEADGFIAAVQFEPGQTARAGDLFCYLAPAPGWTPPAASRATNPADATAAGELPPGLRITQPAMALAQSAGLDLNSLPTGPLVTEKMIRARLEEPLLAADSTPLQGDFDPTAIVVYGGGGHGKALIDLLRVLGTYRIAGVIDDGLPDGSTVMGLPVLGGAERLAELYAQGIRLAVNAVGGIGRVDIRSKVFQKLAEAGFTCPTVIHPTAFVEASATLAAGVQVMPNAYVGSETQVGFGSLVNTGAIVSHDCRIGALANLSPGAILAGEVHVGNGCLIGMGANINLQVKIGAGARIGNGAVVKTDVPAHGIVRAGTIWPA